MIAELKEILGMNGQTSSAEIIRAVAALKMSSDGQSGGDNYSRLNDYSLLGIETGERTRPRPQWKNPFERAILSDYRIQGRKSSLECMAKISEMEYEPGRSLFYKYNGQIYHFSLTGEGYRCEWILAI